jgi:predicted dehydrogenase/threonine dehydrogenase-like Zn-dependent dehydrogenase
MKQILQSLKTGITEVAEVPCPVVLRGQILIRSSRTLVSAGTERMLVEFGKANLIDKARQQPDKVMMVLNKIKTDGLLPTMEAVFNKLDQPLPLGYCNVGTVLEAGPGVTGFEAGVRVVSNGKHAEVVSVPMNLCARVPALVSDDEAAFTVMGAIALQGIRLIKPSLGEAVVVIGLGLLGLVSVQLLRAHGCRVLGLDFDADKLALAQSFGAEVVNLSTGQDPIVVAQAFSRGRGVDAVIIAASTKSNTPIHQAALMCRKRGRIVLVGVTGLDLSRADFYEKELSFQVSCSYGPGRHDPSYEERGNDYPVGFVRWTEQRNFEAVLDMMACGSLNVRPLISHRFDLEQAGQAYALVCGARTSLGILLQYPTPQQMPEEELRRGRVDLKPGTDACRQGGNDGESRTVGNNGDPYFGFVGSGNYATAVLIPAFKAAGARLKTVASSSGLSGLHAGRKFGFNETTTATNDIFDDAAVNAVVVTTRHDSHASFVLKSLAAGKHVFVEKPLCLTLDELTAIEVAKVGSTAMVMVGFNRRFAPQVKKISELLKGTNSTKSFVMTVNAGTIPADHWTQDQGVGGGRLIGEACHFIDLLRFLAGSRITSHQVTKMDSLTDDSVSISLKFEDGSIGVVHYLANGSKAFPKERLEVFASGRVLQLDNFRKLTGFGWPGFTRMNLWRQDKGPKACAASFVQAVVAGSPAPIAFEEIVEVARVSIGVAEQARCL